MVLRDTVSWNIFFCPLFWGSVFQTPNKVQTLINTNYSCSILKHAKKRAQVYPGKSEQQTSKGLLLTILQCFCWLLILLRSISLGCIQKRFLHFYHDYPKTTVKALNSHPKRIKIESSIRELICLPAKTEASEKTRRNASTDTHKTAANIGTLPMFCFKSQRWKMALALPAMDLHGATWTNFAVVKHGMVQQSCTFGTLPRPVMGPNLLPNVEKPQKFGGFLQIWG